MKIKFQADADLRRPIITGLLRREREIDVKTAQEAELEGLDDLAVLARAAEDGRLLLSHDVSTMPENFARFILMRTSPGAILISQQLPYGEVIERLHRVWQTTEAHDWQDIILFLPR